MLHLIQHSPPRPDVPPTPRHSYEVIGDGRSHTIELLLDHKRLTLRVDGGPTRSIVNDGAQQYMRVNAPLYIGGLPREVGVNAYSQWHLRDISSFGGQSTQAVVTVGGVDRNLGSGVYG